MDYQEEERKAVDRLREAVHPPGDATSWVDYATRHQHAGARPCWQCVAREKALAELRRLQEAAVRRCSCGRAH